MTDHRELGTEVHKMIEEFVEPDWNFATRPDQACYCCSHVFEEHKIRKTAEGGRVYMCPNKSGTKFKADHRPKPPKNLKVKEALAVTRTSIHTLQATIGSIIDAKKDKT